MKPSQIIQLLVGIFLGLAVVGTLVGGASFLYLNRFSRIPEKPKFENDPQTSPSAQAKPVKPDPYAAVVIYADGLILRKQPAATAETLKVLTYEEPVMVLEISADQKWQKLKTETEQPLEGWVAAGNTERLPAQP
ncbi:MAG: SH3 domain-containing protein [Acaryochloridaceae cyanobacterium SU_2_1]|nr:SH3 domain-containing protein [Acaryochloridaceae cyanobacterium SU_2_1]